MPNNQYFSGRIPQQLWDAANNAAIASSKTRTQILIEALSAYLEMPTTAKTPIEQKLEEMEQRIADLEAKQVDSKQSRPSLSEFFSEERINKHYGNSSRK